MQVSKLDLEESLKVPVFDSIMSKNPKKGAGRLVYNH